MGWKSNYEKWLGFEGFNEEMKLKLDDMKNDKKLIEDSFYKHLDFGTGGMRGELGAGMNRINIYTVRKTAEGLARFVALGGESAKGLGVVIAYDNRFKSDEFAIQIARVMGLHNIKVYLFDSLRSTPELSFAVRYLRTFAGVMITASHNTKEYNGLKVYGYDGGQLASERARMLVKKVNEVSDELAVEVASEKDLKRNGLLEIVGEDVDNAYMKSLKGLTLNPDVIKSVSNDIQIVYSALHGTGNIPVQKGLEMIGFEGVEVVREQELPDSNFSTVESPNPEEHEAFRMAIDLGYKYNADILLATDPDADRVGVAVKNSFGVYEVLTGNQVGALLLNYLIMEKKRQGTLHDGALVFKTIVTSELGREIASSHGVSTIDTLIGFKYISEWIRELEEESDKSFLFGYEESNGYLFGDFVRDKDAVQTCLLIAEVTAHYKARGLSLYEGLTELYNKYGYYAEDTESVTLRGMDGAVRMNEVMTNLRVNPPKEIAGKRILVTEDYYKGVRVFADSGDSEAITLPSANVIKYKLEGDSWICVRPSGTEPKIKFYYGVKESTESKAFAVLEEIKKDFRINALQV